MANWVTDRDRGARKLLRKIGRRQEVKIGVLGADAHRTGGGITVVEIATIHEFGLGNCPRRSWLRDYVDQNDANLRKYLRNAGKRILVGSISPADALELFGQQVVGEILARILARINPPLDDRTIQRKGSDVPLKDTGQLTSSITYLVDAK